MSTSTLTRRSLAAALSAPFAAMAAASTRPNVLLLHCHDLGQHLHCYGVDGVNSPHLDQLASEGVLFENNFCTAPQCSPSRASIFTGRYPHSNGVMGLAHADFAWDLHPSERHIGQLLGDAGYTTLAVGVIHETSSGASRCGFAEHIKASAAAAMADATIDRLKKFAAAPEKPFYIQAGCIEPHRLPPAERGADQTFTGSYMKPDTSRGVTVPPYLKDTPGTRTELAELQGAIRHMDEQMGRVLAAVRELGLDKNTLVIFTTDHGIAMPRAKCAVYEPGMRTSFILRYPARTGWHGGTRHKTMVSNIDCVPTILDLAGIPIPASIQGRSLAPLLDNRSYTPRDRLFGEITYHDYYDPRRSVRTATHKLIVTFSSAPAFMDPSQSWRPRADTVVPVNHALAYHSAVELYDLARDPREQSDLVKDGASTTVLNQLKAQLAEHMRSTHDPILSGAVTSPLHRRAQSWLLGNKG
jgi:arylsulfatase A-like enzyme